MCRKAVKAIPWVGGMVLAFLLPAWCHAASVELREQVKAAYLYNILQFVTFPEYAFVDSGALTVCILGQDKFGPVLDQIDTAKTAQAELDVIRLGSFSGGDALRECNAIYVVESEKTQIESIMASIDSKSVLTIGEFSPFVENGGLIELFEQDGRIRFRINEKLARQTDYQLAAQLIQLGVRK